METLRKLPVTNKIITLAFGSLSLILIVLYSEIIPPLVDFTEKYVQTYDGVIDDNQIFILEITVMFFIGLCFFISLVFLFNLHKKILSLISSFIDTEKLKHTFLTDNLLSSSTYTEKAVLISTTVVIILHLNFLIFGVSEGSDPNNPFSEGILEHLSSLIFLPSSILLLWSVFYVKKHGISKKHKRYISNWLLFTSAAFLFIFLEEISWGQQYFNWESTGVFKENNFQSETNLHNFINPFFRFIYPLFGIGLFVILCFFWYFFKEEKPYWLQLIVPHKSMIILAFYLACASFIGESEIFEQILSVFTLLYSLRIFLSIKNTNNFRSINI